MENTLAKTRHLDTGDLQVRDFRHFELVKCVRCHTIGEVIFGKFYCKKCQLKLSENNKSLQWFGEKLLASEGSERCFHCGMALFYRKYSDSHIENIPKSVQISCPNCQRLNQISINVYKVVKNNGEDGYFGMPLLLQANCSHGILWAYNWQHLQAIKAFVQADLRERNKRAGNSSLFSRLPLWIKSAKNREVLLKMVQKLEMIYYKEFEKASILTK